MMKLINNKNEEKKLSTIWYITLSVLALIPAILAILYSPVDPDSGYYLSIVERINEGYIPYRELHLGYTPLYFYFLLLLKKMFGITLSYEFYLTIHFILQYLCALIIYKISLVLIGKKSYSFYAGFLFVLMSHWNEGNAVLLEIPSMFLGLWGFYLTIKTEKKVCTFAFAGLLLSLSFLVKQYGLGFFILCFIVLIMNRYTFKNIILFSVSFVIPIIICFTLFGKNFSQILGGNGYGGDFEISNVLNVLIYRAIYLFLRISPVLAISYLFSVFTLKSKIQWNYLLIFSLGILGFMLQFAFGSFTHYYLYILPFVSIIIFYVFAHLKKLKWLFTGVLLLTFALNIYSTYYNRVYKIYIKSKNIKNEQLNLAHLIENTVPINEKLYIADIGLIPQYYLSNRIPPNFDKLGYSFGLGINPEQHLLQIKSADYVLKFSHEYNDFGLNTSDVIKELKNRQAIKLNEEVTIYK